MAMLAGKVVLITDTGGGQGRVAALTFAREGAKVIGCDIKTDGNDETVDLVRRAGGEMTGVAPVDLTDPEQVERFVEDAAAAYGGVRRRLQQRGHAVLRADAGLLRSGLAGDHRR